MVLGAMGFLAGARPAPAAGAVTVAGRVFLDANGNGRPDAGEPGLAGVRVTDGVGFAVTGADGRYRLALAPDPALPVPGTQPVALCWPTGHWPTTPYWRRLKDLPDPAQADFGLCADPGQRLPFTYLHVTDSHDWRASPYERQPATVNLYLPEARFIIHTGDVGWGGATPAQLEASADRIRQCRARCAMPTLGAIGNHDTDMRFGPGHEYNFCGAYVARLGPLRFAFDYAGVHFAFADVLDDDRERNDFTAAWLERDFAALKPGTRIVLAYHYPNPARSAAFRRVIRDHHVALIHAGHTHGYAWYPDFAAPLVTAYARSSASAGVMVVDAQRVNLGFFCDGCGGHGGAGPLVHSRRCPIAWRTHILEAGLKDRFGRTRERPAARLEGAGPALPVATAAAYVAARFTPGAARRAGVQLGPDDAPLTVAYTGQHLVVDGAPFPLPIPARDAGVLDLHLFAHKDLLTVWANEVFFCEQPVRFRQAVAVRAFATGGAAVFNALAVREVNPDPQNTARSYSCACGHGSLQRVP